MLDKKNIEEMREELQKYDEAREKLIKKTRDIIKLSKQLIYAVHKGNKEEAERFRKEIDTEKEKMDEIAKATSNEGSHKVAVQEYVEAVLYHEFFINKKLPTSHELKTSSTNYLLGICDLTGELVRKAVYLAGKGEYGAVEEIKNLVEEIYHELLAFNFRENELRRKFDSIKYDLRKLEDLVLDLKLKEKL